jgi:hypothetical protein
MGSVNSFLHSIPRDYANCSDTQLQQIINSSIISDPWYNIDELKTKYEQHVKWHRISRKLENACRIITPLEECVVSSTRYCESLEEFALYSTIYEMRRKGFRPISVADYRHFLLKYPSPQKKTIKLWVPDGSMLDDVMHHRQKQEAEKKVSHYNNVKYDNSEHHLVREFMPEESNLKFSSQADITLPISKEHLCEHYDRKRKFCDLDVAHYQSEEDAAHISSDCLLERMSVDSQCETEEWPKIR